MPASSDPAPLTERQKSLAFFTLIIALVLEIVDVTIVNTALPSIQAEFGGSGAFAQWVVAGYVLPYALLLMLSGRLGDLFGSRTLFLIGVGGFTAASIGCGLAPSGTMLIVARVLQGAAGALMAPQVLAVIQQLYTPVERIGRLAWFGVIGGLSSIAGPILGGFLIAANIGGLGWRTVFLINGPIGLVALLAGWWLLPRSRGNAATRIDLLGTLSFGIAILALLFPLLQAEKGGLEGPMLVLLIAGVPLLLVAWWMLRRRAAGGGPVLFPPRLLANPVFRAGIVLLLLFSAANTGFLFLFAYALQRLAHFSPFETGLIHMPFSVGVMLGMGVIGRSLARRAEKWILVIGYSLLGVCAAASLVWIDVGGLPLGLLLPALLVAGAGMGMSSGPATPLILAHVDRADAGSASGIVKTVQQMGGVTGIALVGAAFFGLSGARSLLPSTAVIVALLGVGAVMAARLPARIYAD
ncbi:MFS transporter [Sphingomonas azotifigens]|uniref:MFS transporter n=1 Tax=Sphingomonas azotifigens TaxID=330920 RepID=UPI001FE794E2|nr:MFS transporter [Sphingomonas azotifigens]